MATRTTFTTLATTEADPRLLPPPHTAEDRAKIERLASDMRANGWAGRPLLIVNGETWSGSHRLAAAVQAELESIPVVDHQKASVWV